MLAAQLNVPQPVWQQTLDWNFTLQGFGQHGIAVADVNGDGLDDVYVCQPAGLPNRLFPHAPDGRAVEAASAAGVDWLEPTQAALLADFDNDGDPDIVCANDYGRANLFLNRWGEAAAEPTFKDIAREAGM